jgi:hypothetical protein
MQLNFKVGGVKTNRVRVVHRGIEIRRSNGIKLEVIDPNGSVIFSYMFNGIDVGSPLIDDFDMSGRKL